MSISSHYLVVLGMAIGRKAANLFRNLNWSPIDSGKNSVKTAKAAFIEELLDHLEQLVPENSQWILKALNVGQYLHFFPKGIFWRCLMLKNVLQWFSYIYSPNFPRGKFNFQLKLVFIHNVKMCHHCFPIYTLQNFPEENSISNWNLSFIHNVKMY